MSNAVRNSTHLTVLSAAVRVAPDAAADDRPLGVELDLGVGTVLLTEDDLYRFQGLIAAAMAERERAARMARAEQVRARLAPIIAERQAASRPWKTALMRDLGLWAIRDLKAVLGDPGTELPDAYVLDRVEQYLGEHGA